MSDNVASTAAMSLKLAARRANYFQEMWRVMFVKSCSHPPTTNRTKFVKTMRHGAPAVQKQCHQALVFLGVVSSTYCEPAPKHWKWWLVAARCARKHR